MFVASNPEKEHPANSSPGSRINAYTKPHMKSIHWFFLGLGIDTLVLLLTVSNLLMMRADTDGLSSAGRMAVLAMPLVVLALIAVAWWLKSAGKILIANILLWIPALPIAGGVLLWGGLALVFILFGK